MAISQLSMETDERISNQWFSSKTKLCVYMLIMAFGFVCVVVACVMNFSAVKSLQIHDETLTNLEDALLKELNDMCSNTTSTQKPDTRICSVVDEDKFDCHPEPNATAQRCELRGCCWAFKEQEEPSFDNPAPVNIPQCFFPSNFIGYKPYNIKYYPDGMEIKLSRNIPSGLPQDENDVLVELIYYENDLARIKIDSMSNKRWVSPLPEIKHLKRGNNSALETIYDEEHYILSIFADRKRFPKMKPLFSIELSRLILSSQFIQISTLLPSTKVYGLGEMKGPLQRSVNWTRRILFNKDQPPRYNRALYGAHTFMMNLWDDNHASGVYLHNSNIMDVILQPKPAATFRALGGIFDFFIFSGPNPTNVVSQYQHLVGLPAMVPYWSLGFHLCRYGYWSLNKTKETYNRNIKAKVPLEVQWNDIDYMERFNMFTYDQEKFKGLSDFVDEIHETKRKYVMIFDPAVSGSEAPGTYEPYDWGVKLDIFIKDFKGDIAVYKVWNEQSSIFPDFSNPVTETFWTKLISEFHSKIKFDGMWIDMNEPSNQLNGTKSTGTCPQTDNDYPPVVIGGENLFTYTACMSDQLHLGSHYNLHNLYPHFEARATYRALKAVRPQKRPFIISRASSSGQGLWSGHWTGDIDSTWEDMRQSVPDIINFAMYGMPMVGADICGFQFNTTDELCARWHALGAFYPFSRNHNDKYMREQDPAILGGHVLQAAINSLNRKYLFAPYLYTLMYRAHAFGDMVIRGMLFNYPEDPNTHAIDTQFMWGTGLLVVPALYKDQKEVQAYLPAGSWFHINTKTTIELESGEYRTFSAPMDDINLFLREGNIVPGQEITELNLSGNRENGFVLFVVLDSHKFAMGELFWDDGDTIDTVENRTYTHLNFFATRKSVVTHITEDGYKGQKLTLEKITIVGVEKAPTGIKVNDNEPIKTFSYNNSMKVLEIGDLHVDLLAPSNSILLI